MIQLRTCRKCGDQSDLKLFPVYGPHGKRRHECRSCIRSRERSYPKKTGPRPEARPRDLPPVNWTAVYHSGTRCWCCRRNSAGQMLCTSCRAAA